jgi:hypothetical protein
MERQLIALGHRHISHVADRVPSPVRRGVPMATFGPTPTLA